MPQNQSDGNEQQDGQRIVSSDEMINFLVLLLHLGVEDRIAPFIQNKQMIEGDGCKLIYVTQGNPAETELSFCNDNSFLQNNSRSIKCDGQV